MAGLLAVRDDDRPARVVGAHVHLDLAEVLLVDLAPLRAPVGEVRHRLDLADELLAFVLEEEVGDHVTTADLRHGDLVLVAPAADVGNAALLDELHHGVLDAVAQVEERNGASR